MIVVAALFGPQFICTAQILLYSIVVLQELRRGFLVSLYTASVSLILVDFA